MALNTRHKAVLFITIAMTGSALLAGITLNEALGMLMLGAATAWLLGSDTASRIYTSLGKLPARTWPWMRMLFLMAIAGCLLVGVAFSSNFNTFLVATALSVFGIVVATDQKVAAKVWLRIVFWVVAFAIFILVVWGST